MKADSRKMFVIALVLFVFSLPLSAYLLRSNNVEVQQLQEQVLALDKSSNGDIEVIEPALTELAEFSLNHMNANTSVTLEYRYTNYIDSLIDKQEEEASNYRSSVYNRAQEKCSGLSVVGTAKIDCVQNYISSQPGVSALDLPPVDLFFYEYASPTWSLDLAGISVLVSFSLGIIVLVLAVFDYGIPMLIRTVRDDPLE